MRGEVTLLLRGSRLAGQISAGEGGGSRGHEGTGRGIMMGIGINGGGRNDSGASLAPA